jgi:hypothetical protein
VFIGHTRHAGGEKKSTKQHIFRPPCAEIAARREREKPRAPALNCASLRFFRPFRAEIAASRGRESRALDESSRKGEQMQETRNRGEPRASSIPTPLAPTRPRENRLEAPRRDLLELRELARQARRGR